MHSYKIKTELKRYADECKRVWYITNGRNKLGYFNKRIIAVDFIDMFLSMLEYTKENQRA